ncbi:hypothetical protein [Niastella populi]|nr:hypothetical protein [Niastella populi]
MTQPTNMNVRLLAGVFSISLLFTAWNIDGVDGAGSTTGAPN